MQTGTREAIDGDLGERFTSLTEYRTTENQHAIICGSCSKTLYANDLAYSSINRAIERGLDDPFVCEDCQEMIDDEAHSHGY